jgi:hypothetical protein
MNFDVNGGDRHHLYENLLRHCPLLRKLVLPCTPKRTIMQRLRSEGLLFQNLEVLELRMQVDRFGSDIVAPLHLCGPKLRGFRLSGPQINCDCAWFYV